MKFEFPSEPHEKEAKKFIEEFYTAASAINGDDGLALNGWINSSAIWILPTCRLREFPLLPIFMFQKRGVSSV